MALEQETEGSDVVKHDATITEVLPGNEAFRLGIAFYRFKLLEALCSEMIERKKGKRKPLVGGKRVRMVGVIRRTYAKALFQSELTKCSIFLLKNC